MISGITWMVNFSYLVLQKSYFTEDNSHLYWFNSVKTLYSVTLVLLTG